MRKCIILYTGLLLSVSGCSLLELDESTGLNREEAYSYFSNVKGLATYVYSQLPGDLGVLDGALRESATDNSVYIWSDNSVHDFYNNAWSPNNAVDNMWSKCYGAIRSVNSFLENYSQERLERFRWNDTYEEDIAKATMDREELRVLRAFYLFELAKRYGDIPLLTRTYALDEINSVEKSSFSEVIKYICDECSDAAKTLPVSHQDFWAETGRVTKGTALALKSRALLYAASMLHNPSQDADKWKAAADAAYAIIKENWYSLPKTNADPLYDKNGGNDVLKSPQLIFERRNGESFDFEANNLPISYEKGETGNVPTQNLVDAFQLTNGKDFDWEQLAPGQNPYEGRDPRFYKTVLCNGDTWMNSTIQSYEGGKDGAGTAGATTTGYYLKKYMNETVSLTPSNEKKKPHHFIIFRYAEILLIRAEAGAELGQDPELDKTINALRDRVGFNHHLTTNPIEDPKLVAEYPTIKGPNANLIREIRRERRVELMAEGYRYHDLMRWACGIRLNQPKLGIIPDKATSENDLNGYNTKDYESIKSGLGFVDGAIDVYTKRMTNPVPNFIDPKNYLFSIPTNQIGLNPNLKQNPGWD